MATVLQKIKNKIIDKTSDVLSLPAQIRSGRVARKADADVVNLKADRASGGNAIAPDPTNPAYQTRALANDARYRRGAKMI